MGSKFKQKKNLSRENGPRSRKDKRKQLRKEKKAKKNEYFKNKKILFKKANPNELKNGAKFNQNKDKTKPKHSFSVIPKNQKAIHTQNINEKQTAPEKSNKEAKKPNINKAENVKPSFLDDQNKQHKKELKEKAMLEKGIRKQRKRTLLEANKDEDKEIKKLEKQLKLNKRKSKSLPKSFAEEGLDWLLDVCDFDKMQDAAKTEMNLQESGSEFEDDFAQITGKKKRKSEDEDKLSHKKNKTGSIGKTNKESEISDSESENSYDEEEEDEFSDNEEFSDMGDENIGSDKNYSSESENDERNGKNSGDESTEEVEIDGEEDEDFESEGKDTDNSSDEMNKSDVDESCVKGKESKDGLWEDIYGRLRDKKGNVVQGQEKGKYVPPQLRAKQLGQDEKRSEELARLKKQLKGLVNRLAESNVHSIANQIDELYMRNSRNDMNDTLLSLISEVLVAQVLTPERLIMEHTLLIAVLHANVGMEVGAHFLQSFVEKFDLLFKQGQDVENKELDNVLLIISHMYNFKMFHSVLMYNILEKLSEQFSEKEVELILLVLRSVGFSLRKDDPSALKDLVLRLQKKAGEASQLKDNPRVRFMLETLLAVKNNNMSKIPQYDPSYSEHLKKLLKTLVHKGKYVTELKITLEDLLKAEERGRWWIVGSAWSGAPVTPVIGPKTSSAGKADSQFSQKVLDLARKQRMNTDTRRNIFCILVTAEDYLDAFEKLLRLGLKAQQEQEIIYVMIHCLLQEKTYNPYYSHLATHFCQADRKHQMTIQYHLWDKLKELSDMSQSKITNLAKFLAHMFLEKALPISVLKVMQFSEMDKSCVRLLRQVLLSVLLSESEETMAAVFSRVSRPDKLRMFRESLRLFLHHFVLRNVKDLPTEQAITLRERVKLAETALTLDDNRSKLL